ncbi:MAG TPA: prepilin-type N-terminal cleavage/methylation domain-containing protein [Phycisphaerales bacterium]|nr:prepilin-type N-terminal cleavage/methylation domain-containing protein [Phycisphaerales bacterium]
MQSKTVSIRKAFTLLEIIIVVIMIGIMSSIVLPRLVLIDILFPITCLAYE